MEGGKVCHFATAATALLGEGRKVARDRVCFSCPGRSGSVSVSLCVRACVFSPVPLVCPRGPIPPPFPPPLPLLSHDVPFGSLCVFVHLLPSFPFSPSPYY